MSELTLKVERLRQAGFIYESYIIAPKFTVGQIIKDNSRSSQFINFGPPVWQSFPVSSLYCVNANLMLVFCSELS